VTRIRPINDKVLLKREAKEIVTPWGLIIPEVAQEDNDRARVVAVGPGRELPNGKRVEPRVKVGDLVILSKWDGSQVVLEGVKHLFLREDLIEAVLEE
jgi:chaperonin GroES